MPKKQTQPKLHKTIFQIRYEPHLCFYDTFRKAASCFEIYDNWSTDGKRVTLRDFEKHNSVTVAHNHLTFVSDAPKISDHEEIIIPIVKKLLPSLTKKKISRLGYRQIFLCPVDLAFADAVDILDVKLYSQDSILKQVLPGAKEDIYLQLHSSDAEFHYNTRLGPVRKSEIAKQLELDIENHFETDSNEDDFFKLVSKFPEVALFIDLDSYKQFEEGAEILELCNISDVLRSKASVFSKEISDYCFSI